MGASASCSRSAHARRPLVVRLRRHPLGRGDLPRPGRARRRPLARRADPRALHGAPRASRPAARLGRRQAQRDRPSCSSRSPPRRRRSCSTLLGVEDDELRAKVIAAAEGNPLFVEEMLALVERLARRRGRRAADDPGAARRAARPARSKRAERARVRLRRGADLPPRRRAGARSGRGRSCRSGSSRSCARSSFARTSRSSPGEDAFRFRHLLIREAAYEALPKATRAELHERFADWLGEHGAGARRAGRDPRRTTWSRPPVTRGARTARRRRWPSAQASGLATAGRRALWRGTAARPAPCSSGRSSSTRPLRLDVHLELDLAQSLQWVDLEKAAAVADGGGRAAPVPPATRPGALLALTVAGLLPLRSTPPIRTSTSWSGSRRLPCRCSSRTHDHAGLVHVWYALGFGVAKLPWPVRETPSTRPSRQCEHARLAGQRRSFLFYLVLALAHGSTAGRRGAAPRRCRPSRRTRTPTTC